MASSNECITQVTASASASSRCQQKRRITTRTAGENLVRSLAYFKKKPLYGAADFTSYRPSEVPSCKCTHREEVDAVVLNGETRIRNIFDVGSELGKSGVIFNSYRFLAYALQRPRFSTFEDVSPMVLTSSLVTEAKIRTAKEMRAAELDVDEKLLNKRAKKILKKMKASISSSLIKFTGWFLLKFLGLFLRTIQVHRSQMAVVKRASQYGHPLIFLPLHRSHLDYVLITFLLWNYDIRAPYVAAGNNMDIPFFNLLMRGLGGFYIRRKLDQEAGKRDHIYRAVLHAYMSELLKKGEGMEFFLEGGRSRSNRPINPKAGLISVVVDNFLEGNISDAYIIPVSISYEKIIDGNFNREQMGLPKVPESFFGALKGILRILFQDFGSVRVDFIQPLCLKDYIHKNLRELTSSASDSSLSDPSSPDNSSPRDLPLHCPVSIPPSQSGQFIGGRKIVKSLADHVIYLAAQGKALMCTNLVAFLMLTCHREGCSVRELEMSFRWLKWEVLNRHFDVGFSGMDEDIIAYALNLLGQDLIHTEGDRGEEWLVPELSLPTVFELSYQSGPVLIPFLLESIVACAVIAEGNICPLVPVTCVDSEDGIAVLREGVMQTAKDLCTLLADEFIIAPPCEDLEFLLSEVVDKFIAMEILSVPSTGDMPWSRRIVNYYEYEDDDDDESEFTQQQPLTVNLAQALVRQKLQFYQHVLAPILESYLVVAYQVTDLLTREVPEDDFFREISKLAIERVESKVSFYAESAAMDVLKNAVGALCRLKVLHSYSEGNLKMLTVEEEASKKGLNELIHLLQNARG